MMSRSMLAYLPVNIASIIVSFGTIIILTRLFDGAEFGRYALAMITVQFVHMGLYTWLEAALARFQARAERDQDVPTHLKTIYAYAALMGGAGCLLTGLIVVLLPLSALMTSLMLFVLCTTPIQLFINLGTEAHKASHRIGRYSAVFTAQTLLGFSLGLLVLLTTHLREIAPFIGIVVANLCVLAVELPFMWRRMRGGRIEFARTKRYFAYGMPICVSLLLSYMLSSADMYIISGLMGDAAAGQYNAGYNLANRSLDVIFIWVAMAVTPIAITTLEHEGLEKSLSIMKNYASTLLLITLPAATGIALVAEPAGFILGEPVRAEAVSIMPLIAFAGVMNGLISYYAQRAFMLSGHTDQFMWAMVPPVILNIGLNFILIPRFGLMGAVYATVAAYGMGLVLAILIGRRHYPLPLPFVDFFQIGLACCVMALGVRVLPLSPEFPDFVVLIIKASVGALIYIGVCLSLNIARCRTLLQQWLSRRTLGRDDLGEIS